MASCGSAARRPQRKPAIVPKRSQRKLMGLKECTTTLWWHRKASLHLRPRSSGRTRLQPLSALSACGYIYAKGPLPRIAILNVDRRAPDNRFDLLPVEIPSAVAINVKIPLVGESIVRAA